ncbi:MAG: hypothetical protein OER56_17660 [Hyphomicrobiales bacterium]|nr:hypothetical protein [Hyphomicrobiales bacterium]
MRYLKWVLTAAAFAAGLYVLHTSYTTYGKWYHTLALGDHSGAELYEVEFWLKTPLAMLLILASTFLAGRWSGKESVHDEG